MGGVRTTRGKDIERQMKATDPDSRLTALFEEHYDEVLAYCTRRIGWDEADDVASEVFAVAWRRIDDIDWTTVRPWLYGIARHVIANRWRSLRRRNRLQDKLAGLAQPINDSPEVSLVRREEDQQVIDCLMRLKPTDREILMLAAWEGLTAPEVGLVLGIATSTAEQRLHRARKRFAAVLRDRRPASRFLPVLHEKGGGR